MNAKERRKFNRQQRPLDQALIQLDFGPGGLVPKMEKVWIEPDPERCEEIKRWRVEPSGEIIDMTPASVNKELEELAARLHHQWSFIGPPKPRRLQWMEMHLTLPFTADDAKAAVSRHDVLAVVKNMPPIAGVINVSKG